MNINKTFLACFIVCSLLKTAFAQNTSYSLVSYLSPKPNSFHNHASTNVIIKFQNSFDASTIITNNPFRISCQNVNIAYISKVLEDNKTILLQPVTPLPSDKKIKVELVNSVALAGNKTVQPFTFVFYTNTTISEKFINNEPSLPVINTSNDKINEGIVETGSQSISEIISKQIPLTITRNNHTSTGYYFMTAISKSTSYPQSCLILDHDGQIIYEKQLNQYALDFKKLHDHVFSFFNTEDGSYHLLDEKFADIGIVKAGNGYLTDNHELQYEKKTGNYILLAQESVQVNMADSILGGNPNANVLGLVIQEIDPHGNVVFEWKTLDHLSIMACKGQDLLASYIDYVHCNAIEIESDTSLLLSSRHLNEITKIDRRTGEIIWRMGPYSNYNNFSFSNDAGFTYQHDIRRLPNGHITLFDNGNLRNGGAFYSRAVEYEVDEVLKKVKLVWQYDDSQQVYGPFLGRVQRMRNGNTLIGWGGTTLAFTEIDSLNNKVLEVSYGQLAWSYRCHRYDDLDSVIALNQIPLAFPNRLVFCNEDTNKVYNNLSDYLLPSTVTSDNYEIKRDNNDINVYTKTSNNFFNSEETKLQFPFDKLVQRDTIVCLGSTYKLNSSGACKNVRYKWSTNDSTSSIDINPTQSATYWVEMTNGTYLRRDSVRINVSSVPNFSILGMHQFLTPYQINTYSVPFNPGYKYVWDINKGNIIAGYGTNAITVQLDNVDTIDIVSRVTNSVGCKSEAQINVLKQNIINSVDELNNASALNVYPNPTTGTLHVLYPFDQYSLYDLTGRLIRPAAKGNGLNPSQINIDELPSGTYILYLTTREKTERFKIEKL